MFLDIAPDWQAALRATGLDAFASLWNLDRDWVEAPNERRGGWSGVVRRRLDDGRTLFIKRQEGQNRRTWRHPLRGRPTYFLEYRFLKQYRSRFPQLVDWACYGESRAADRDRAVLATAGLTEYRDLNQAAAAESREALKTLLERAARAILPLHRNRLQHGALYAVHVFAQNGGDDIKLIDLERARFRRSRRSAALSDLSQFIRRTTWLDRELAEVFLQPWEEQFPGISKQLPQPAEGQKDAS